MGSLSEDPYQGGEFTIEWIDMGMATDKLIRDAAETMDFTDIFSVGIYIHISIYTYIK
jgi:hypothetical protein